MARHPDSPAGDTRQSDRLDAFLDALAHGNPAMPPRDLDPTLATTVRHVHSLAGESVAADIQRAGKAQRWEDLMRHNVAHATVTPFPTITLPSSSSSSAPAMAPPRPAVQRSRLRRLGGQSLGLVATLTLVLLVATSGLAVYLSAPRGGNEPTMFPAAFGATPEGTPTTSAGVPADLVHPILTACDVQPRTIENVLGVLATPLNERTVELSLPQSFQRHPAGGADQGVPLNPINLPDGVVPDQAAIDAVTATFGQFQACARLQERLRTTALYTDHGLILANWISGEPNGVELVRLAQTPVPFEGAQASIGQPSADALWGFRTLDDGRIAAWLLASGDADLGLLPVGQDFVVFAFVDNRWLIDEMRGPSRG
jgi:hypothetical protein